MEHSEHISGHGHGHGEADSKLIGLTIALIGVLLAFCAAMVASERNELTRAMIEQTQAHSDYTSASTKFRLVMLEVEKLRVGLKDEAVPADGPSGPIVRRFVRLYSDYSKERAFTKEWSHAFQPVIDSHFVASEDYEKAQLLAEIGIVVASLAVLLHNKKAWYVSLIMAGLCVGQLGRTWQHQHSTLHSLEGKVEETGEAYKELRKAHVNANEDEKAIEQLDPGGKLRAEFDKPSQEKPAEGPAHH